MRGEPIGHFVILCGYDKEERTVLVADPLKSNPLSDSHQYLVNIDRVICSILLGIMTYDANLLIIEPARNQPGNQSGNQQEDKWGDHREDHHAGEMSAEADRRR